MNDILTKLAGLTQKDENGLLPCPFCREAITWFRDPKDGGIDKQLHKLDGHRWRIIQRNGKAFHAPESERRRRDGGGRERKFLGFRVRGRWRSGPSAHPEVFLVTLAGDSFRNRHYFQRAPPSTIR
jgi:hypothetical protein